jgi:hypothetical protein
MSFRQRRNHIKLAYQYEIPRASEGQKNRVIAGQSVKKMFSEHF